MGDLVADPVQAALGFAGGKGEQFLLETYRDLVTLSSAQRSYRRMYLDIASGDVPALIHCTTGKDRTGWAAAALLMFAGASEEDVFDDYMLTNESLLPEFEEMFVQFEKLGGDRSLLVPLLGVERKYLEAAVDEALRRYGTIDEYFASGLGLDDDSLQTLRTRMIDNETPGLSNRPVVYCVRPERTRRSMQAAIARPIATRRGQRTNPRMSRIAVPRLWPAGFR